MGNKLYQNVFVVTLYISYFLFALSISGIYTITPAYIINLRSFLRYYVCIFLIIRFNPFTNYRKISKEDISFDRNIAFTAGVFLLLSTSIIDSVSKYTMIPLPSNL
jgi:hypothetical protein